jgi:archaellum component FlaC
MGIDEAKEEVEKGDYEEAFEDIEEQIDTVEKDFEEVKTDDASGDLKRKQQKAEQILERIHEQIDMLEEHVDFDTETNKNF